MYNFEYRTNTFLSRRVPLTTSADYDGYELAPHFSFIRILEHSTPGIEEEREVESIELCVISNLICWRCHCRYLPCFTAFSSTFMELALDRSNNRCIECIVCCFNLLSVEPSVVSKRLTKLINLSYSKQRRQICLGLRSLIEQPVK